MAHEPARDEEPRSAKPLVPPKAGTPPRTGALRGAIYTRKSSEEGLKQNFNLLHAQHEACEAYGRLFCVRASGVYL